MKETGSSENKSHQSSQSAIGGNILITKHPLADAEEAIDDNDPQKFYYKLNACLKKYLGEKFSVSQHELGKKRLQNYWIKTMYQ